MARGVGCKGGVYARCLCLTVCHLAGFRCKWSEWSAPVVSSRACTGHGHAQRPGAREAPLCGPWRLRGAGGFSTILPAPGLGRGTDTPSPLQRAGTPVRYHGQLQCTRTAPPSPCGIKSKRICWMPAIPRGTTTMFTWRTTSRQQRTTPHGCVSGWTRKYGCSPVDWAAAGALEQRTNAADLVGLLPQL